MHVIVCLLMVSFLVQAADNEHDATCGKQVMQGVKWLGRQTYEIGDQLVFLTHYAWITRDELAEGAFNNVIALFAQRERRIRVRIAQKEKQD